MQAELREKSWGTEPLCVVKVLQVDISLCVHVPHNRVCHEEREEESGGWGRQMSYNQHNAVWRVNLSYTEIDRFAARTTPWLNDVRAAWHRWHRLLRHFWYSLITASHRFTFVTGRWLVYKCGIYKCGSWLLRLEFAYRILIFGVLKQRLLQQGETEASFVCVILTRIGPLLHFYTSHNFSLPTTCGIFQNRRPNSTAA